MVTISENLQIIKSSTDAIKQAIIDKGGTISGDITTWADAISGISGGGSAEEEITFTGTLTFSGGTYTLTGDLSKAVPDALYVSLVMAFRNDSGLHMANTGITSSIKNLSISCSYGMSPTWGDAIPALFIVYQKDGTFESGVVPVKFIQN